MEFRNARYSSGPATQRNLKVHPTPRGKNSEHLAQGPVRVRDVFEHMWSEQHVDRFVGKVDVLQIETDVSLMGGQIEVARGVRERSSHRSTVGLTQPWTRFEDT